MVYLLWTRTSLANFYEAVSLAFIKRNSCPVKFDFERHEAVNVSGPILRRCAMFRPPAYQYIHLFLLFSGWAPHQLSFLLEKCTLCDGIVWLHSSLYTSCPYEFFRVLSIRTFHLWDDAPRTHSRKPGQKAWQSVWWRAIMVPCAKVWITSLMKTFVNWIIARRRPDQMTSFPTKIAYMWHDLVKEVLVEARG